MKLGQKIPSGMETGFSVCTEDFKPGGFKMFLKKILISKPKFLEQILKCSRISRAKIASAHGNKFPLNFRKIVLWRKLFSVRKKVHLWKYKSKFDGA